MVSINDDDECNLIINETFLLPDTIVCACGQDDSTSETPISHGRAFRLDGVLCLAVKGFITVKGPTGEEALISQLKAFTERCVLSCEGVNAVTGPTGEAPISSARAVTGRCDS